MPHHPVRPWLPALLAAAAISLWWLAIVRLVYQGQTTALFMIGEHTPMPDWLEKAEPPYRWKGSTGYDGQYFHLLAHAPFAFRRLAPLLDRPRMRTQRILVPCLAWLLAGGRQPWIDHAYLIVILAFLAAGVFWTARIAHHFGASPWWGAMFLALPASLASLERMLADGPLLAAAAGFLLYMETGRRRAAWLLAAAAPFIRESGLVLALAAAMLAYGRRSWKAAALWAAAAAPFLGWLYSIRDLPGGADFRWAGPFHSVLLLAAHPETITRYAAWRGWLQALDLAVLFSLLGACLASLTRIWKAWRGQVALTAPAAVAAITAAAALLACHLEPRHAWDSVFSAGRVFAPVYLGLLLEGLRTGRLWFPLSCLAPAALRSALPLIVAACRALACGLIPS